MNINKNFLKQLIREEMSKLEEVSFGELDVIFEDAVRSSLEKNFGVIVRELKSFTTEDDNVPSKLVSVLNDIIYDMAEHIEDRDDYETLKDEMILPKYAIAVDSVLKKDEIASYEDDIEIEVEEDMLNESTGKGCADTPKGCIRKRDGKWVILNNKKGGVWRECDSKAHCEEILDAFHASKG